MDLGSEFVTEAVTFAVNSNRIEPMRVDPATMFHFKTNEPTKLTKKVMILLSC